MTDLYDQCRILYHLYMLSLTGGKSGLWLMAQDKELKYMYKAGTLGPALYRLIKAGYVKDDNKALFGMGLELTREGLIAIEYMKKSSPGELRTWINNLELNRNDSLVLIRDSYHFYTNVSEVEKAFHA